MLSLHDTSKNKAGRRAFITSQTSMSMPSSKMFCVTQMALIHVSEAEVAENEERSAAAQAKMKAKQDEDARSGAEASLSAEKTTLEGIQAQISQLRTVRGSGEGLVGVKYGES